ncbi:hypothetical protein ASG54_14990 [Aureimonas sp. Leaf460]|uniref:hypothetical protein n=2 Tax=unclassified Aureimonas TaxID=2615206 RepID=UPI0006F743E2|nr:hypothetical protein [Aureimonas sp. Leaf460]KQT69768.1 hypothetical protein ASG62_01230 [Aureimonas sp. Leaf427]KQT76080.1 hypothetical protein ASG54_14990 [Aureimonas sp. Leaf460]
MASFDDWLTVTDPRLFGEALAEQFRLSQKELEKATQALAPAFAIGFQNALADPKSWQDLSKAFYGLVPGLSGATPGQGHAGEIFTKTFFGSDALVSAVARQASLVAGIAPDTLQKLMPGLAALTMQAMVRTSMENLTRNAPAGLATGDLGGATAEMMRRGANAVEALSRPSDSGRGAAFANPMAGPLGGMADVFSQSLKASLSWMQPGPAAEAKKPESPKAPPPIDPMAPFAAMFKAFADGMSGAAAQKEPPPPPAPEPAAPAPSGDLVEGLMRSGQSLGDGYAREMAALFERYGRPSKAS